MNPSSAKVSAAVAVLLTLSTVAAGVLAGHQSARLEAFEQQWADHEGACLSDPACDLGKVDRQRQRDYDASFGTWSHSGPLAAALLAFLAAVMTAEALRNRRVKTA